MLSAAIKFASPYQHVYGLRVALGAPSKVEAILYIGTYISALYIGRLGWIYIALALYFMIGPL